MLRFLISISLCLLIVFTGIGALLSRQWGWSEYASSELYLAYQDVSQPASFFLTDANGSDQQWKLSSKAGTLAALNCSPDGRTLAFLTASGHLYVVSQAGLLYDRVLGQGYDAIAAANDGKVALAKREFGIVLVISRQGVSVPVPPDHIAYDPIKIASSGASLWSHSGLGGIKLVAPSGDTLLTLSGGAFSPAWLASEQMFAFSYVDQASRLNGGVMDTADQQVVRLRNGVLRDAILSPDATRQALPIFDSATHAQQVSLVDPLSGQPKQQLTHDTGIDHMPICFLTFRPQMLIADSP